MELTKTLARNYIFREVSTPVVNTIAGLAEIRNFEHGDVLVRQFDFNSDLIVVLDGEAMVRTFSGEQIAQIGPGSIVGEVSLIDEQPRSATVVATKNGSAAIIPAKALRSVLEMDAEAGRIIVTNLCRVLCRRLRTMNVHVDGIRSED